MAGGRDFSVAETIYEEQEDDLFSSPSPPLTTAICSGSSSSLIFYLRASVEAWSKATGKQTEVIVDVQGQCFNLHKDPLASSSRYFERLLSVSAVKTVYVPSCVTAETFALVACFCYKSELVITPFNVAPLRVAAELLEMDDSGRGDVRSLKQITEAYFCQAIGVNTEYASIILRTCFSLMPEAEETAFLLSRCIEALDLMDGVDGRTDDLIDGVQSMTFEQFQLVARSMRGRFSGNHDLLYKVVDLYLKEHACSLTEQQKTQMCCAIDCNKLSEGVIMHAVQNPDMPLRFVIRAMLVEQLNTRRSIAAASDRLHACKTIGSCANTTLGAILQRDASVHYTAQLRAAMEVTGARISSLEHELVTMKTRLHGPENRGEALDSGRSASCRFAWEGPRGERDMARKASQLSPPLERPSNTATQRNIGRRLSNKLKSMFWTSKASA